MHNKPRLRFAEFTEEWQWKKLGEVCERISQGGTPSTGNADYWGGSVQWLTPAEMEKGNSKFICETRRTLTEEGLRKCSSELLPPYSVIISTRAPIGHLNINTVPMAINQGCKGIIINDSNSVSFVYYSLYRSKIALANLGAGNTFKEITGATLKSFSIPLPSLPEQEKIAECLSSLDELISAEREKLTLFEEYKRGLMQGLFPNTHNNLHNKTDSKYNEDDQEITAPPPPLPRLRFKEFTGEWKMVKLGELLEYEQPTKYLVRNTEYNDSYDTPVLTAGKTFILGYTKEKEGIYDNGLPVIIFDDFTTASKFVTFPFKAKSSAMKILSSKQGANIKFIFESMQMINYQVGAHERHWISTFSNIQIPLPSLPEQKKIAECLSSLDELITASSEYVETLETMKKGLMQGMFPVNA